MRLGTKYIMFSIPSHFSEVPPPSKAMTLEGLNLYNAFAMAWRGMLANNVSKQSIVILKGF